MKSGAAIPWGAWPSYFKGNPDLAERHKTPKQRNAIRVWRMRSMVSKCKHGSLPDSEVAKRLTLDSGYGKGGALWDKLRRRRRRLQGRPQKTPVARELLFDWFSVLRNSVSTRIFP